MDKYAVGTKFEEEVVEGGRSLLCSISLTSEQ